MEPKIQNWNLVFVPGVGGLDRDHPKVEGTSDELVSDLSESDDLTVSEVDTDGREGAKGDWSDLVIAFGGPSGIVAIARIVRLWIGRDRDRSIEFRQIDQSGPPKTLRIDGRKLSNESFEHLIEQYLDQTRKEAQTNDPEDDPDDSN